MKRVRNLFQLNACLFLAAAVCVGCAKKESAKSVDQPAKSDAAVSDAAVSDDTAKAEPTASAPATSEPTASETTANAAPSPPAAAPPTEKPAQGNKVKLGSPELTAGVPGEGPLKMAEIEAWLNDPKNHEVLEVELPLGLATGAAQIQGLDKNPLTRAKIELGRQLYFDPRLSADRSVACASCHHPDEGFAKHTQFGVGIQSQVGGRNSPVSYNRILSGPQFWDGRAESLEAQAVGPIANPIEMGNTHDACVECLKGIAGYKLQFEKIFGKMDIDTIGQALASFERAIVTEPTPFDYNERMKPFEGLDPEELKDDPETKAKYDEAVAALKEHPISEGAKRGREIFFSEKGGCSQCHVGANLADEKYHNLGVGMDKEKPDIGREEVTKDPKDRGAFKTPTIRNVALSAPYMHDGSQQTLEDVVEWYAKGGHPNPNLSEKVKKLNLTDQDKKDLVEFMKQGCSSDFPKVNRERLPE